MASKYTLSRQCSRLSALPEGGSVQARYCVNVIGPDARDFVKLLQSATEHAAVEEMANPNDHEDEDATVKMFFLVDEAEETIVRVQFNMVQEFSDNVTEIKDQLAVCNTLYLFVADVRETTDQGLCIEFQSRLCEIKFQYEAARKKASEKQFPCPLAVMLFHAEAAAGECLPDGSMPKELLSFNEKLCEIADTNAVQVQRCVDFTKASLAYKCLTQVVADMYMADKSLKRKYSHDTGPVPAKKVSSRSCSLL